MTKSSQASALSFQLVALVAQTSLPVILSLFLVAQASLPVVGLALLLGCATKRAATVQTVERQSLPHIAAAVADFTNSMPSFYIDHGDCRACVDIKTSATSILLRWWEARDMTNWWQITSWLTLASFMPIGGRTNWGGICIHELPCDGARQFQAEIFVDGLSKRDETFRAP